MNIETSLKSNKRMKVQLDKDKEYLQCWLLTFLFHRMSLDCAINMFTVS